MSRIVLRLLAALLLWVGAALVSAADSPAIEGKWLSEPQVTSSGYRWLAGAEIRRAANGELEGFLYGTLINMYGARLGRFVEAGPNHYKIAGDNVEFWLGPDGSMRIAGFGENPIPLHRVDAMPRPPGPPDAPAGPGPRWSTRLGGAIFAPAAVHDGFAYVGNSDGVFFAVDVADGQVAWHFPAGRPIYGEALATADAIYFACDNGYLFKLNRADGKEVWRYDLGDGRVARIPPNPYAGDYDWRTPQPLLVDGTLFAGAGDGGFHAVNASSGQQIWRISSNGRIPNTAVAHGPNVIFATMGGWVCAVDRGTGVEAWSFRKASPTTSGPALLDDAVIVGNRGSRFRALDARDGSVRWTTDFGGSWVESTAVFRDGRGYIGSGDLFLVSSFDPPTGKTLWQTHVNGWVLQRVALTEDLVFAAVSGARRRGTTALQSTALMALDRASGKIVWSWNMPDWPGAFLLGFVAAPVLAGDTVIAGGIDGSLYAFPATR